MRRLCLHALVAWTFLLTATTQVWCQTANFKRGDSNVDFAVDISDAIYVLGFLFLGEPKALVCEDSADSNDDGVLDISDVIYSLGFLFLGSPLFLPSPSIECGSDPTVDRLSCRSFKPCSVKNEPPTSPELIAAIPRVADAAGNTGVVLSWTPAKDDHTLPANMVYEVHLSFDDELIPTDRSLASQVNGEVFVTVDVTEFLPDFFAFVVARDEAGESSGPSQAFAIIMPGGALPVVHVPSAACKTIQQGVHCVSDGGIVMVAPGRYEEVIEVKDKTVHILGQEDATGSRTVLVNPDRVGPVITFRERGGGSVSNMDIQGGGIVGISEQNPFGGPAVLPAPVNLHDLRISEADHGISGEFGELSVVEAEISLMSSHGAFFRTFGNLRLLNFFVHDVDDVGLWIVNVDPNAPVGPKYLLYNVNQSFNAGGGMLIQGGAKPVEINSGNFLGNTKFGILLFEACGVDVLHCNFNNTLGDFGAGIVELLSDQVRVEDSLMSNNCVGMMFFGGDVTVANTDLNCNTFDLLEVSELNGLEAVMGFHNGGGVCCACGGQACQCIFDSLRLGPPTPAGLQPTTGCN